MNSKMILHILKTTVLILAVTFLADKVVFFTLNSLSDKVFTGQTIGKLNQYLEIKDGLDFIVFGSSRANHNIDPRAITKNSFNMGMDGRKLAYSATLIKLLPLKQKQTVLLHIDSENAFSSTYSGSDIKALSIKYNRNKIIKREIKHLNKINVLQNFYWSLSYNSSVLGILKNFLKSKYNYKTYSGYDPIYVTENQKKIFENILNRPEEQTDCETSFKLNSIYDNYLNELALFCKDNNKNLILFTAPKYNDNCKIDNEELYNILQNKKINYYDFTDFFKTNNKLEYWKDKEHLSAKGADIFTKKIEKTILQE